jgi:dienelactone hydrolase
MAEIGWPVICRRAIAALKNLPDSTILAGFSMGAGVIASLWNQRPDSKAVLLFHGLAEIPRNVKPGLKVQTHIAGVDQFVSDEQRALWAGSAQTTGLLIENHDYLNTGHFFTDFQLDRLQCRRLGTCMETRIGFPGPTMIWRTE